MTIDELRAEKDRLEKNITDLITAVTRVDIGVEETERLAAPSMYRYNVKVNVNVFDDKNTY